MLDEVNDTGLRVPVKDKILSGIEKIVGLGVFGGLENFINLDRICLMIVLNSEQKDGG